MASIDFELAGSFQGINESNGNKIGNPTSLQFGPDGRLYVSFQNGTVKAFTVEQNANGEYISTAQEELLLPGGGGIVKSIQNHNDDGSDAGNASRQVTGLLVTGTAENPVLYVSSSDPRIAKNGEKNLDTNSGVITQATWTGSEWDVVDIVRGLPRSEENHSVNGMELSPDGTKLYVTVGGNTNNGAPSLFFSYTGEYALAGTILEVDLTDIGQRDVLIDPNGGQNGSRQYVYDLPTLDDPNIENVTDGVGEDEFGMDEDGPWGGNDGLNQAILPGDAPLRIMADGLRNQYDLELTSAGNLYTVDNGSNKNLGGDPAVGGDGQVTNDIVEGGTGDPEPLFLIEEGGYYGHPAPARANQDLGWVVYDDNGNPDASLSVNTVSDLSELVPDGVDIPDGFLIHPDKFTDDPARLAESGVRIERSSSESNAIATLGSSSNGLVEYTADAYDSALQGSLLVTQFNGSVTLLNLDDTGTALEPLIGPGPDGALGTADDELIDEDGIYPLITGQSQPLDVTVGPDGSIWVAEFGPDNIKVFVPGEGGISEDLDNDGILNALDPFSRDASNGTSVVLTPGETLLWDFDADSDGNLPGPDGYATGLTGVMIDGVTDYDAFFLEPSTLPDQDIKLDNVKFATAAGGGTTVLEFVSDGDPFLGTNSGEFLFHTGLQIDDTVETFTIKWSVFNPGTALTGASQQIGGYIGTGDQSNYLKIVALATEPTSGAGVGPTGEIQILLENNDQVESTTTLAAADIFNVPNNQKIFFELEIDPAAGTATPTVTYQTGGGNSTTVSGGAINLSGTAVLDAILGNHTVQGETTGLAVGLFSSNTGQAGGADAFSAIFDDIEIVAADATTGTSLVTIASTGGASEPSDNGQFTVSLSQVNPDADTVISYTIGGTATAGTDYTALTGVVTIPQGQSSADIIVAVADDDDIEGSETVTVTLDSVTAGDAELGATTAATVTIADDDVASGNIVAAINAGGPALVQDGISFSADTFFLNGKTFTDNNNGNGQQPVFDGTIYETERFGNPFEYEIPVAAGDYTLELYFAEIFLPNGSGDGVGDRVFDVLVEGQVVLDDVDILAQTGGDINSPLVLPLAGTFSPDSFGNGNALDIVFDGVSDNAKVSGIVVRTADGTTPTKVLTITGSDGAEPNTDGQFTVTLSSAASAATTVSYSVSGTATAGTDYTALSGEVVIAAGDTSATIDVVVADDDDVEGPESVIVTLDSVSGDPDAVLVGSPSATVEIADEDIPPVDDKILSITGTGGAEPGTNGEFIVSLSEAASEATTVSYSVSGTATAGTDYTALSGEVVIAAGDTSATIDVVVADDDDVEGTESVIVTLDGVSGDPDAVLGTNISATAEITDDDLGTGDVVVAINAGGPALVQDGISFSADTSFLNGKAFTDNAGGNGQQPVFDGTIYETERFGNPFEYEIAVAPGDYTLEFYFAEIFLPDGAGDGIGDRVFDVLVEGQVVLNDVDILAQTGGDINTPLVLPIQTTFSPDSFGNLNALDIVFDGVSDNAKVSGIVVRTADGSPPPADKVLSITGLDGAEPGTDGEFTVSLSEAASEATTVSYSVGGTATAGTDYTALSGEVVIAAGDTSATIDVVVADDDDVEGTESVIVTLDGVSGDPDAVLGNSTAATVEIADNDTDVPDTPTTVVIEAEDIANVTGYRIENKAIASGGQMLSLVAGSGGEVGTATFNFDGASGVYDFVIGTFDESDGNASFEVAVNGTVVGTVVLDENPAGAGASGQTKVERLAVAGLALENGDEVTITGFENVSEHARLDFVRLEVSTSNPSTDKVLSITGMDGAEPGTDGEFTVSLSEAASEATTVSYSVGGTATSGTDYTALSGEVVIAAGDTNATIDVVVADDDDVEGTESVIVTLDGVSGDPDAVLGNSTAATVEIADNDIPDTPTTVVIEAEDIANVTGYRIENKSIASGGQMLSLVAGNGGEVGTATFNFDGASGNYDFVIGTFDESDGNASFEVAVNGTVVGTVVLDENPAGAGANGQTKVERLAVAGLALENGDEVTITGFENVSEHARLDFVRLEVSTSNPSTDKVLSITGDSDGAEPGTDGQFTVSLSEAASEATTVSYSIGGTATAGTDYTALSGEVVIAAGDTSATIDVVVADDDDIEGTESVIVTLDGVSGDPDAVLGNSTSATVEIADDDVEASPKVLSITGLDGAEPGTNGEFTVSLSEAASEATTVSYSIGGTATAGTDYTALSGEVVIAAGDTSATIDVVVADDDDIEGTESVIVTLDGVSGDPDAVLGTSTEATVEIADDDVEVSPLLGEAVMTITVADNFNVQKSNFGNNSFQITNTGEKKIAQVELDVTNALYPDSVFDPFGLAGDTVTKELTINDDGGTGAVNPSTYDPYIGAGGTAGFTGITLLFEESANGGFETGETVGFSVDMDPNSVAGTQKNLLDGGTDPNWDVGGVSGAELIGSTFTVTFTDGTMATGQLHGANNRAGSKGLASQDSPEIPVALTVNGLDAGGVGTYDADGPTVIVNGPAGETARIVLTKGFIQPVNPYSPELEQQLAELAAQDFPANNAVEFQTVDIVLTGGDQDITSEFNFSDVSGFTFTGEDQVPLGFVAAVIDPTNDDLPVGPVTQPIYLQFDDGTAGGTASVVEETTTEEPLNVVSEEPVTEEPVTEEPVTEEPVTEEPVTEEPVTETPAIASGVYLGEDGDIAIEAESAELEGDWTLTTIDGRTAVLYDGPNSFGKVPSGQTLEYVIQPDETGTYGISLFTARDNTVMEEFRNDLGNDAWIEIENAATGEVVQEPIKLYTGFNTLNGEFRWGTKFDVNHEKLDAEVDLEAGVQYIFKISGRSEGYAIDRFTLRNGGFMKWKDAPLSEITGESTTPSAVVTPIENPNAPSVGAEGQLTYEAEAADIITNYRNESLGAASGGEVLSFQGGSGGESGSATFGFNDAAGSYDVIVGAFDENDGIAQFTVELNDVETGTITEIGMVELDSDLGSGGANLQTAVSLTVASGISLTPGDSLTVKGFEGGGEHARLDYMELVPTF